MSIRALKRWANCARHFGVHAVLGNHDYYNNASMACALAGPS